MADTGDLSSRGPRSKRGAGSKPKNGNGNGSRALSENEALVAALEALHRGDFGHRLRLRDGVSREVTDSFNALAERLEEFAFFQRVSESAVIEHSLAAFFAQSPDDEKLGEQLRQTGAGRRRKTT